MLATVDQTLLNMFRNPWQPMVCPQRKVFWGFWRINAT